MSCGVLCCGYFARGAVVLAVHGLWWRSVLTRRRLVGRFSISGKMRNVFVVPLIHIAGTQLRRYFGRHLRVLVLSNARSN